MAELGQITFDTTTRVAISGLIVASVLAVRFFVRRYRERRDADLGTVRRLTLSTLIAGATALGVIGLLGVWGLTDSLNQAYGDLNLAGQFPQVVLSVVILGGAYALTDFLGQIIREIVSAGDSISDHQQEMLYRLTQLSIYSLAFLVVVGLFTENLGSLLVGAGFLGIVVGMAARQTLGAVLAGIVLMFSRPFEIGDWVVVGDHEGVVTNITIVNTRIRTFDGEHVTIPNDVVGGNPVLDRTKEDRLRIEVEVGIDYEDDPERAAEIAVEAARGVDNVLEMPSPQVVGKRFADSAVVLGVRYWIDNPSSRKRWRTRTGVIAAVHEAFAEEGITIPFPQRTHSAREGGVGVRLDAADDRGRGEEASDGGGDR
ncbi:mechanosensitive ion channel family protein [Haloparvum sedimenti]|uniref:mechanosensitive ion channel family protein n=1 Tax=Haloparvum sedimenti TaxID=1678448 RepID=UPI001FE0ABCB|nr:mechanosensitive ion channel family protein [Haloparvum sedimenti]